MSDTPPVQEADESAPIPLHPEEGPDLTEVASAVAQAKANEARLRKVSSAYKQLQGEMQAMRDGGLLVLLLRLGARRRRQRPR